MPAAIFAVCACRGSARRDGRGQRTGASIISAWLRLRAEANAVAGASVRPARADATGSGVGGLVAGMRCES